MISEATKLSKKERKSRNAKAYYAAHRESICRKVRLYYHSHAEEIALRDKQRWPRRRLKVLAQDRARYLLNRKEKLEYARKYREANKDRVKANKARYHKKAKAKYPARFTARNATRRDLKRSTMTDSKAVCQFYESVRQRRWIKCYYCGAKIRGKDAHIDHVVALAKGGNHAVENLAASCASCNQSKGAKLPHEWPKHPQVFLTI